MGSNAPGQKALTRPAEARSRARIDLLAAYRQMVLIRYFEEMVQVLFGRGLLPGTTHLCQGQEAVSVGVAAALRPHDAITYTYRSHGHVLARGMDPFQAFAEILGRVSGCNRGKGGSMHLTDARLGLWGSFAIVGAGLPVAVGLARAFQLDGNGAVSVTFFGDGATNIGAFHEALNLASVWRAPVVFICENNLYGEYSRIDKTTPITDLAVRAQSYAMPSTIADGNDVEAVVEAAAVAVDRARTGGGPTLIEYKTYRQSGHSRADPAKYRSPEEVQAWLARDPIRLLRQRLLTDGKPEADLRDVEQRIRGEIEEAARRAQEAPWPDASDATTDVYA